MIFRPIVALLLASLALLVACSDGNNNNKNVQPPPPEVSQQLMAGAASRSILPTVVAAICRYGQGLGRELGEPDNHYEETNAAGWDLVDDIWAAAQRMFQ